MDIVQNQLRIKERSNGNIQPFYLKHFFSFLLSVITLIVIELLFGFYWEESMKFPPAIIYGNISAPPYNAWFDESFLLQPPIVAYLSAYFSKIPVLGLWHLAILVLYLYTWFHLTLRILNRLVKINKPITILLSCLFVWSFIGTSLVYVHLARESIFLCTGSLLLYLDYYLHENKKPNGFILLFLFGCLIRVSTGIMVLFLISVLLLLYFKSIKRVINPIKAHWTIALICLSTVLIYKYSNVNPAMAIQQTYEYALEDRGAIVQISTMKTSEDSIRYQALTQYFLISDSAQINLDFIKRVVDNDKITKLSMTSDDLRHIKKTLLPLLRQEGLVLFLSYLLLITLALNTSTRNLKVIFLFQTFGWIIVGVLAMKISMYDRFLQPWISTLIATSILLISVDLLSVNKWQRAITVILLFSITFILVVDLREKSTQEKVYNKASYIYMKRLESVSKNSTPIIWDYSQAYFPTSIFSRKELNPLNNCIYQTSFFIMFYQFGQERCFRKYNFSPLNWRDMGLKLKKNRDKICFIMEDRTANFLDLYYKRIYNINFKLIKDFPVNEICPGNFVYHLQSE